MGVQFKIPYAGSETAAKYYDRIRKQQRVRVNYPRKIQIPILPQPQPQPKPQLPPIPNMSSSMRSIAEKVCIKHRILVNELISESRSQKLVNARREYIVKVRDELEKSFPQIGKSINKDHTTILHGYYSAKADPSKMEPWTPTRSPPKPLKPLPPLTPFQEQVYGLMKAGLSNLEIAIKLNRTKKQAKNDRYYVNKKLRRRENI